MAVSVCSCSLKHVFLYTLKYFSKFRLKFIQRNFCLFSVVSSYNYTFICFYVLRTNLHSYRDTAHFLVCKLKARCLITVIKLNSEVCAEPVFKLISLLKHSFFILHNRNYHNLCRSNSRWEHKSVIVSMYHNNCPYHSGTYSPGSLMCILYTVILIGECYIIGSCKAVSEVVAGT